MIQIPQTRLLCLNQTENRNWIRSEDSTDEVLTIPEAFVQLRCLKFLRQRTLAVDYGSCYNQVHTSLEPEDVLMRRADRCIVRLRKAFTCCADVTPILFKIMSNGNKRMDLETLQYCRNFDDILAWTRERKVQVLPDRQGW